MKIHSKKKAFRAAMKDAAKRGLINTAEGKMVPRSQVVQNAMARDYSPQEGK